MNKYYEKPKLYKVREVEDFLKNNKINDFVSGVIGLALYSEDRKEVKELVVKSFLENNNKEIKLACIKALSHIARIDRNLKEKKVFNELDRLSDISFFSPSLIR
ncbi:hypothetical protein [Psychrobacter sp. FDAARGOS_221]|uniref:hypothetical protein n=1 Tax=Psychrobacter sp. FDAARGOS_221 TaxID=1975705 RepID=UPI000BB54D4D|nr:hypothetical protein [Psychrobacter sp. FDAARGOS_221]PNK59546.1 hypothetical protein A6J60_000700 [Psychrobacter sp. FDAARGOS_221]